MERPGERRRRLRPRSRSTRPSSPLHREPVLRVIGVGGAGVNAVDRMIEAQVQGVEFIAVNTDVQSLEQSSAPDARAHRQRLHARPGRRRRARDRPPAALEQYDELKSLLKGADMVFITAGAGGGTGTGAAPVVARISREVGALTVGIVTKPFAFEGVRRGHAGRAGRGGDGRRGRHPHHDPELAAAVGAGQEDVDGRRLPRGRRRAAPGRAGHLRPDRPAGADQPGLRRRAHDHDPGRQRAAGHRHGHRREPGPGRRRHARWSRRCWRPRWTARSRSCCPSPAARTCRCSRSTTRPRPCQEAAHPDANIIFGAMVDEKLGDEVWITVVATGYGDRSDAASRVATVRARPWTRTTSRGSPGRGRRASAWAPGWTTWTCLSSSLGADVLPRPAPAGLGQLRLGREAVALRLRAFVTVPSRPGPGYGGDRELVRVDLAIRG